MARGDQLARTWQLIRRLERQRGRGLTVEELCEEGDWNRRTVYRDINALMDAGFPIEKENCDSRVYYRFTKEFREGLPPTFSLTEIVALNLSHDLLKMLKGTFFYDSIESAFGKIKAILPPKAIQFLSQIEQSIHTGIFPKANLEDFGKTLDILYDAVIQKKVCRITYHSASSQRKISRLIEPYKVWFTNGSVYVVAFDRESQEQRTFSLTRIEKCEVVDAEIFSQRDFDFDSYRSGALRVWRGSPEKVQIHFMPAIATVIEENAWHETQKSIRFPDGSLQLELHVAITPELENWVMSWGAHAVVLAPEILRNNILSHLQEASRLYQNGPTTQSLRKLGNRN